MTSPSDMNRSSQIRTYDRAISIVFMKTNEEFGGLSNMAGGFPLKVNGLCIRTSEALYQACRFPHLPEVQRLIVGQASPMTAKMKSKPHRAQSRPDWESVRVKIMRWCLRVKLAQHWRRFGDLLLSTCDSPIVEQSYKDTFWGAKPVDEETLVGTNVLGRLLMELREELKRDWQATLKCIEPLPIANFLLDGRPIQPIAVDISPADRGLQKEGERRSENTNASAKQSQTTLFAESIWGRHRCRKCSSL